MRKCVLLFSIFLIALIVASIFERTKNNTTENEIVMDSISKSNLMSNANNN